MRFVRRLFRRRDAPAPISEREAYGHAYGDRTGDIIRVEPIPPPEPEEPNPFEDLTGELLRRAFEKRLDSRHKTR